MPRRVTGACDKRKTDYLDFRDNRHQLTHAKKMSTDTSAGSFVIVAAVWNHVSAPPSKF